MKDSYSKFQFKEFAVRQCDSAMKIGTDGVLLGAWSKVSPSAKKVLDIGTGTGLIALMLAQRFSHILVDAIELDQSAAAEASHNFFQSKWSNRLNCKAVSLQDFAMLVTNKYDHIICNPPFYQGTYAIAQKARDQARNHTFLPLDELFLGINKLLSSKGSCSLILPIEYKAMALEEATKHKLNLNRFTAVKGNETASIKRALLSFGRSSSLCETKTLTLEIERHKRTKDHQDLVNPFYLSKP